MSLPPLPDELARFTPTEGQHRALQMFVREYGQACRAAALAELHVPEADFGNIVEPVAWMYEQATYLEGDLRGRQWYPHVSTTRPGKPWMVRDLTPLYLHPAPQQVAGPSGERAELIEKLRNFAREFEIECHVECIEDAVNMLEADAQQAKPKTAGDVQDMCIAALQRDERAKVGDSRFESWYSELNQAGKGSKQIAREAYEAGLHEADAQQAKQVPLSDVEIYVTSKRFKATFELVPSREVIAFARAIEAHHGISPK